MKKVYQDIIDKDDGNCMQSVVASLLDLDLKDVPHFLRLKSKWFSTMMNLFKDHGYHYHRTMYNKNYSRFLTPRFSCFKVEKWHKPSMLTLSNLKKSGGIDGYFFASVLSPAYFDYKDNFTAYHAVVIDSNCRIVHDPNPNYDHIREYPLAKLFRYNGIIEVFNISKTEK